MLDERNLLDDRDKSGIDRHHEFCKGEGSRGEAVVFNHCCLEIAPFTIILKNCPFLVFDIVSILPPRCFFVLIPIETI